MKRTSLAIFCLLFYHALVSAQEPIYLFEDFTTSRFLLKRHISTRADFNFDTRGQKLYFMQNDDIMEMTNCDQIDTIFVNDRKFVWKDGRLCEYVRKEYGDLFINWKFRDSFVGKEGAMGLTTQGKVEVMQVPGLNSKYSYDNIGKYEDKTDVWTVKNENTYYLTRGNEECRIRHLTDLYRAFPDKADDIRLFMRKYNYTMKSAEEAEYIFSYIFTGSLPDADVTNDNPE